MRQLFILTFIFTTLFSCKKDNSSNVTPIAPDLVGKWRMVSVKDNSTNITTTKPSSISGNVDITFAFTTSEAGTMNGLTPTNSLYSDYLIGRNRTISIPAVTATKIIETSWGLLFLDNVTNSQDFIFDTDGRLNINISTNKTLTFVRL